MQFTDTRQELRLADYNQGRRHGNGSGQAGAFGTNTGFGGFGGQNPGGSFGSNNQGSGLFGSQPASTASPFNSSQTATSGFGSNNNTSGLFGGGGTKQGGIFGSTSQSSGGLFGNAQSGGFGSQSNNTTGSGTGFGASSGSGLFGQNNQQQQQQQPPKPSFSFGQNNNTSGFGTSSTSGFGTGNTGASTSGGLFGNAQTSTPFGANQSQTASNPFSGFGSAQQNQNQSGTTSAFSGFGSNNQQQQKPVGLFGTSNTTSNQAGGLFGTNSTNNNQQQQNSGSLFGNANNNNQSGSNSLFGAKPAPTSGSLFGNNNAASNNSGGGLFGTNANNQKQQAQSGGIFGNANNQQQQKQGGLFGSSTVNGLFGNNSATNQQQNSTSSIFGNLGSNNQQQQSGGLFSGNTGNSNSSLFNTSQQQQQPNNNLQAPQAYTASITDAYPYGNASIFDGLPPPPQENPGPIATPISSKQKLKKNAVLPQYKINPLIASTRYVTPQKRGYGFSYSTYGTPSSVSSNVSTPGGLSSSLLHNSLSRGLGKSLSTSNLRQAFDSGQESLLSPGAFSAGSGRFTGGGSLKKLTIDRSLRTDLFSNPGASSYSSSERNDRDAPPRIRKKVSFDASTVGGNGGHPNTNSSHGTNGLVGAENDRPDSVAASEQAPKQSSSHLNGSTAEPKPNGVSAQPEMEQVRGNELAVIAEDSNHESAIIENTNKSSQLSQLDPEPGFYYMRPSRKELDRMSKEQKAHVTNFCIGREGCGYVVFDQPVDLNSVDLDEIEGKIAIINVRSLTIYPPGYRKPPPGQGLNVPSTIYLANSWPRTRDRKMPSYEKSGPRFNKHVDRLRKVQDTQFVRYEKDTGTWVFRVPHFTTYGFDYENDESGAGSLLTSTLSTPPDSPTPRSQRARAGFTPMHVAHNSSTSTSEISQLSSDPDDTFEFRKRKVLPGAFEGSNALEQDFKKDHDIQEADSEESILDQRSVSSSPSYNEEPDVLYGVQGGSQAGDLEMAGSFPNGDQSDRQERDVVVPKSILKNSHFQAHLSSDSPVKLGYSERGEWADKLQRTISPRKQDRQALRESQANLMHEREADQEGAPRTISRYAAKEPVFATSIDLMNSLFGQDRRDQNRRGKEISRQGKASKV